MYIPVKSGSPTVKNTSSFMAKKGINQRDLAQLLDPTSALDIVNYLITAEGGLEKRGGLELLFNAVSGVGGSMLEKWTDDIYLFGYDGKLKAYTKSTDTITSIKDDFVNADVNGSRAGDYFLVASSGNKLGRTTFTLDYDSMAGAFTAGQVVTGGLSGATALILEDEDRYTPAFLTGDTGAESTAATWAAVTDGSFRVTIDGSAHNVDAIDFTGDVDMDDVAETIQTALRATTSGLETVVWSTDHFIISSVDDSATSAITVLETSTGTVGTDISGAGGSDWMDADAANGVVTNKVQDRGTLTLGSITGTFVNFDPLTDPLTGVAFADGTVYFTYTEITDAPKARGIKVIGKRAFAFDLEGDRESVAYSGSDDGTNPPYTDWTVGADADDPGKVTYRNAGTVNDVNNLGENIIAFATAGKWAFNLSQLDSAGTIKKIENPVMYRDDAGGYTSLQTKEGLFYVNDNGIYQMMALGAVDVDFSDQEILTSDQLGDNYFNDYDFSNANFVKDDKTNTLLLTCADDAVSNNTVLVYNTQLKAYGRFTGWKINRFLNDRGVIYGLGSDEAKVWQIFDGYDDDGNDIWTEFYQELQTGSLEGIQEMLGQYIQGELSPSTSLDIRFDIYDRTGTFVKDKLKLRWTASEGIGGVDEYGSSSWGSSPWGGDSDLAGVIEQFAGYRGRIKNYQRIRVRITGHDQVPHTINWLSIQTKQKMPIRRRNLTNIT